MPLGQWGILRITARMKNDVVGDVENVFYMQASDSISDSDSDILDGIETWLDNVYSNMAGMSDDNNPYDFKVDEVERSGGKVQLVRSLGVRAWTLTTPPVSSADPFPQGCTAVVNFRTLQPQVNGRKYFGTWTDSSANGDTWVSSLLSDFTTAAGYVLAAISLTGGDLSPGVVSTVYDGLIGNGFHIFTEAVVNPIVGYLRSRKRNRGS